jgi:hypothetical protein
MEKMSLMDEANEMRPAEAAELERIEGGTKPLDVKQVIGALVRDALLDVGSAVVKTFVNAFNVAKGLVS